MKQLVHEKKVTIHELKTWPEYFFHIMTGEKPFDIRKNDRDFKQGDIVVFCEYMIDFKKYTGSKTVKMISYVLKSFPGLEENFCVIGLIANPIPISELQISICM